MGSSARSISSDKIYFVAWNVARFRGIINNLVNSVVIVRSFREFYDAYFWGKAKDIWDDWLNIQPPYAICAPVPLVHLAQATEKEPAVKHFKKLCQVAKGIYLIISAEFRETYYKFECAIQDFVSLETFLSIICIPDQIGQLHIFCVVWVSGILWSFIMKRIYTGAGYNVYWNLHTPLGMLRVNKFQVFSRIQCTRNKFSVLHLAVGAWVWSTSFQYHSQP